MEPDCKATNDEMATIVEANETNHLARPHCRPQCTDQPDTRNSQRDGALNDGSTNDSDNTQPTLSSINDRLPHTRYTEEGVRHTSQRRNGQQQNPWETAKQCENTHGCAIECVHCVVNGNRLALRIKHNVAKVAAPGEVLEHA